jgi:hypothetical protein
MSLVPFKINIVCFYIQPSLAEFCSGDVMCLLKDGAQF